MQEQADPDARLMLRVQQGDREAFELIVEKYKQPILNLLSRSLNDPNEAEDLAQNVFVQVYKSAQRYRPTARFSTWIYTIARNLCLNEIRRRTRHPAESLEAGNLPSDEGPSRQWPDTRSESSAAGLLRTELQEKVAQAIAELPEKQRLAILLCQDEELSYEEISQVLECSVSATKSLIFRAREQLKARLKPYLNSGVWKSEGSNFAPLPVIKENEAS